MTTPPELPNECTLKIRLLSDTVPGRGEGVAGSVDAEIEHDQWGFPYLHGRRIKGLLAAQCAEILGALRYQQQVGDWEAVANDLFGVSGATENTSSLATFSHATLSHGLHTGVDALKFDRMDVLGALTVIRRQTRINEESGAAEDNSLRATRAVRRNLFFTATVRFHGKPTAKAIGLLAACAMSLRHIGVHRARGLGLVRTELHVPGFNDPLSLFEQEVR